MRIEQLRSFIAIYETASFTAAAEQLYTSQPAVSRHATQLEEELGGPLFVRTTRHVAPTKAGNVLYEKAHTALALIDEGVAACKALNSHCGRVAVGYEYMYMDQISVPWLQEYKDSISSHTLIDLVEQPLPQLFKGLLEERVDCVFVGLTKEAIIPAYLEKRAITSMEEVIFVGPGHPLAGRPFVTIDDLLDEEFVYPLIKPTSRESVVVRDFEERGKSPRCTTTLHQPSALNVVERGSAIIDLPAKYALESPHLVRVPYQSANQITYFFIWNRANDNESFAQFRTFVEEKIAALQD